MDRAEKLARLRRIADVRTKLDEERDRLIRELVEPHPPGRPKKGEQNSVTEVAEAARLTRGRVHQIVNES